jgi:hypothetical protein
MEVMYTTGHLPPSDFIGPLVRPTTDLDVAAIRKILVSLT